MKAFFVDMGRFVLETSDSLPFPIDGEQLFCLVSKGHLTYPKIDTSEIEDKNKSDNVVRYIIHTTFIIECLLWTVGSSQSVKF